MAKRTGLGRGLDSLISGGSPPGKADASRKQKTKKTVGKKQTANSKPKPTPAKPDLPEGTRPFPKKAAAPEAGSGLLELPIGQLVPNPHQPRRDFNETGIRELAESIRAEGLLQPVVVRRVEDRYQLIAGERRWRACQLLKMKQIPVRLVEATETSSAVLSLIENLQREDLDPIEEALGYASLMKDFGLTQEGVSERVGRSRASIANALRLLQLPREIQGFLVKEHLSVGHAKVLLGMAEEEHRLQLARQSIEHGWSVRELERQVERLRQGVARKPLRRAVPAPEQGAIEALQRQLSGVLGTPVSLKHSPRKGRIIIEYFGNDDLQRIIEKMGVQG